MKKITFTTICKNCNKINAVSVSKNQEKKLIPRYCIECGNKTDYSKKT